MSDTLKEAVTKCRRHTLRPAADGSVITSEADTHTTWRPKTRQAFISFSSQTSTLQDKVEELRHHWPLDTLQWSTILKWYYSGSIPRQCVTFIHALCSYPATHGSRFGGFYYRRNAPSCVETQWSGAWITCGFTWKSNAGRKMRSNSTNVGLQNSHTAVQRQPQLNEMNVGQYNGYDDTAAPPTTSGYRRTGEGNMKTSGVWHVVNQKTIRTVYKRLDSTASELLTFAPILPSPLGAVTHHLAPMAKVKWSFSTVHAWRMAHWVYWKPCSTFPWPQQTLWSPALTEKNYVKCITWRQKNYAAFCLISNSKISTFPNS